MSVPRSYRTAGVGLESWSVSLQWGSQLLKDMIRKLGADQTRIFFFYPLKGGFCPRQLLRDKTSVLLIL